MCAKCEERACARLFASLLRYPKLPVSFRIASPLFERLEQASQCIVLEQKQISSTENTKQKKEN